MLNLAHADINSKERKMSLFDSLSKIAAHVENQRPLIASEDDTILVSIQPFVRSLGYDTQNLAEFRAQFSADAKTKGGEKVDYAILRDGKPIIFIEVKAAYISLNETHWKQLYNYFNAEDVQFGILTNGIEYHFYTDLKKSNVMDKEPFLVIDMLNLDERLVAELDGFKKTGFDPERVVAGARKMVMARQLKQEMNNPSDEIARHFAKQLTTRRLSSDDLPHYAGLVREAWQEIAGQEDLDSNAEPGADDKKIVKPSPEKDIPVYGEYKGKSFEAEILRSKLKEGFNGASNLIRDKGQITMARTAMIAAIQTVDPAFNPTSKKYFGLGFWHVIDPADGTQRPLYLMSKHVAEPDEALRQRILSS